MKQSVAPFPPMSQGLFQVVSMTLVATAVLIPLAALAVGGVAVKSVLVSSAVCLIPGVGIVLMSGWQSFRNPMVCLAASMCIRMMAIVPAIVGAHFWCPKLKFAEFYLWLVIFYCVTLAGETYFLSRSVKNQPRAQS